MIPSGRSPWLALSRLVGAVAIRVLGCLGQDGAELGRIMDIGGGDLDPVDQPCPLVGGNMGLVAMHWLATVMPGPTPLAILWAIKQRAKLSRFWSAPLAVDKVKLLF